MVALGAVPRSRGAGTSWPVEGGGGRTGHRAERLVRPNVGTGRPAAASPARPGPKGNWRTLSDWVCLASERGAREKRAVAVRPESALGPGLARAPPGGIGGLADEGDPWPLADPTPCRHYTSAVQDKDAQGAIAEVGERLGRPVTEGESRSVLRFFELLLVWNRSINLTGARAVDTLIAEHLPDSLALTRLVPAGHTLLDVGAGGGLPAIPFGLLRPDVPLTLLEPRTRRAAFLRTALRELKLSAQVDTRRLEQVETRFDVLSARAVLPPDPWVTAASTRLNPEGRIIVYLTDPLDWRPPPPFQVAASIPYKAAHHNRLALALAVPRGT